MAPTIRHCDASGGTTAGCQEIGYVRTALRATRTEGALLLLAVSMCIFAIAEGATGFTIRPPRFFSPFSGSRSRTRGKTVLTSGFSVLTFGKSKPASVFPPARRLAFLPATVLAMPGWRMPDSLNIHKKQRPHTGSLCQEISTFSVSVPHAPQDTGIPGVCVVFHMR